MRLACAKKWPALCDLELSNEIPPSMTSHSDSGSYVYQSKKFPEPEKESFRIQPLRRMMPCIERGYGYYLLTEFSNDLAKFAERKIIRQFDYRSKTLGARVKTLKFVCDRLRLLNGEGGRMMAAHKVQLHIISKSRLAAFGAKMHTRFQSSTGPSCFPCKSGSFARCS